MENENKWEYDYSASDNETGYPNVGSSGMNTANQYNEPEAQPVRPAYTAPADGGSVPPIPPEQPQDCAPQQPEKPRRKKKKFNGGKLVRSAVALVLAAAMGFAGGFVGAKYGGGSKVVIQQVERPASSDSSTDSTGNSISATSGTGLSTAQVAELVSPSVVVITTEQVVYSQWSWYGQSQVESGAGSGVIISSDGYILTCAHVVSGASNITVSIGDKDYPATLVGEDTTSDIAVVKVDATGLTPVVIGKSSDMLVGEQVTTIGNPLGELTFSESTGIISALDRSITMSDGRQMNMIQTDCAINSGNSGGPLFNSHGEVIGIVSAKYSSGSNSSSASVEGLGFAIPMDDVASMVSDLVKNGYVTGKPIMGISVADVDESVTSYGVPQGAIIRVVTPDLCGAKAGLQAGDIVTKIDNTDVTSASDLTSAIGNYKPGDKVTLTIFRSGETKTVEVTLEESTPEKTEKQNQAQQEYQQEYQQSQQQQQQSQQQQQGSSGWPFGSFGY